MVDPTPPPHMSSSPQRLPTPSLVLFLSVYALQGVVYAYVATYSVLHMVADGVPDNTAGQIQTLILLPLLFKFVFGPITDRFSLLGLGHRRPYIVLGCLIQSAALVALMVVDPGPNPWGFAVLAILAVVGFAVTDTCTDGMVVEATPERQRDRVQGLLVFSRFATAALASTIFGAWLNAGADRSIDLSLMPRVLGSAAALGVVPILVALTTTEPRRDSPGDRFDWSALSILLRPRSLMLIAYASLYAIATQSAIYQLSLFHQRGVGLGSDQIGWLASLKDIGRAVGALGLPLLVWRFRRVHLIVAALLGLSLIECGQLLVDGFATAFIGALALGMIVGLLDAMFYVLAMGATSKRLAASTFALFMAISNIGALGTGLFATIVGDLGPIPTPDPAAIKSTERDDPQTDDKTDYASVDPPDGDEAPDMPLGRDAIRRRYARAFLTMAGISLLAIPLGWQLARTIGTEGDKRDENPHDPDNTLTAAGD